jgi:putative membrane protein
VLAHVPFTAVWQPGVLVATVSLQVCYLFLVSRWGRRLLPGAGPVPARQAAAFLAGALVLFFAFGSPLDYLSDTYLFSVHMVQHLLEMLVMVPLLLAGTPDWLLRPLVRWRPLAVALRFLTRPMVSAILFAAVVAVFHAPLLYDETLVNDSFHLFEHALFFLAALFFWWPLLSRIPEIPRLESGMRILYLVETMGLTQPVNFLLFLAHSPWYRPYVAALAAHPGFGVSALGDQQFGAVIMAGSTFLVFGIVAIASLARYDPAFWYA